MLRFARDTRPSAGRPTRFRVLRLGAGLLAAWLAGPALSAREADGMPSISAAETTADLVSGDIVATGGARLSYEGALLTAEEIRYNPKTRVATAQGKAALTREGRRLVATSITYRLADRSFAVGDLRIGEHPFFVSAAAISGSPERMVLSDARLYFGEPGPWTPSASASEVVYEEGRLLRAKGARFGIGAVRLPPIPEFTSNLRAPVVENVFARAGYRSSLGAFVYAGGEIPVGSVFKPGLAVGLFTDRGLLAGPTASYATGDAGHRTTGRIRTGYIHDNGDRKSDVLGRAVPEDRGFVEWRHRSDFGPRMSVVGRASYWSDSEVIRDFLSDEFFPVQTPDSFIEASRKGDNHVLSLFMRAQPNAYHSVQERLPEVRLDVPVSPLPLGFVHSFQGSAAVLREDRDGVQGDLRSDRLDAYYGLSRPWSPREGVSFRPVAGGRVTHYAKAFGGRDTYTRVLGELGADMNATFSRVFDYRNERWDIDGLRHLSLPHLSYRYIPKADKGAAYIPRIDRRPFTTYLEPLGLGERRNIDDLAPTHTARLGWDNLLQTRDAAYGSRDLVRLDLAADLRVDPQPWQDDVGFLHARLAARPARWLQVEVYQSLDAERFKGREFNTGVTLISSDDLRFRLSTHHLARQIEEYVGEVETRLNEVYSGLIKLHYDARTGRMVEQAYGLRQLLGSTWDVTYEIRLYDGPRRESSFGFRVQVDLLKF